MGIFRPIYLHILINATEEQGVSERNERNSELCIKFSDNSVYKEYSRLRACGSKLGF